MDDKSRKILTGLHKLNIKLSNAMDGSGPPLTDEEFEIIDAFVDSYNNLTKFNFLEHLKTQKEWSEKTYGPGMRTAGVIDHIRKELIEIEGNPSDIFEWIDVILLACDGAWRSGHSPQEIIDTLKIKFAKNMNRKWPDWRTVPADKAIEHDRSKDTWDEVVPLEKGHY